MKRNIYYCYALIEPHQQPHHSFIFYIFFSLFKLFFPLFSKKKKKKLLFSLLVHTPIITLFPTFPFLFYFLSPHYFTVILPSSFLYILFLYLNFSSPYFQKKKKKKLFFSLLVHAPTDALLPTFSFLFCLFISPLLYRYTSFLFFFLYFNSSSTHFILYK